MNAPAVISSAKQAGFSEGEHTHEQAAGCYSFLHPTTQGQSGRRVFISNSLTGKFEGMRESDLDAVFHQLTKLKAIAGNINSFSAKEKAAQHITILGKVQVTYDITQDAVNGLAGGVYINDIDLAAFGQRDAGLYKVTKGTRGWTIPDQPTKKITTKLAAINGFCRDASQAANTIIPKMLLKAYAPLEDGVNVHSEGEYSLFYNPPSMYSKGMQYENTSTNSRVTMNELKKSMVASQKSNQKVRWAVHGDGAHVLLDALSSLPPGQNLSCHQVMLLNPTVDVAKLLPLMRKANMSLHEDVQKIQENDVLSVKAQLGNNKALKKELEQFPGFENKAKSLSTQSRNTRDKMIDTVVSAGLMGTSVTAAATAALGLTVAALPALATAAVTGGGYAAYKTYRSASSTAKNSRNMLATGMADPSVNPHLNPFEDTADLNAAMTDRFGGLSKSFYSVIMHKLKRNA